MNITIPPNQLSNTEQLYPIATAVMLLQSYKCMHIDAFMATILASISKMNRLFISPG
jgi:hypothetical protein